MIETKNNNIELLAPAGNYNSFIAACKSGANAIYMGIDKFNARVMAENLTIDKYIECIEYAHLRDVKVYLTLNTLLYDNEINEALELAYKLYLNGLDAVIVQDMGIASLIHELIPNLDLHASTQMSAYNLEQVSVLKDMGFKRVVLARELSINEIEYICKNTDVEIEVFVHGALCVSFSGQCLLSSTIGDRSANRGSCAQPCRMKYRLYDKGSKKLLSRDAYLLSKKDIFGFEHLENLINIGVTSLKIEGRNKNPEYVANTVTNYRKKIDSIILGNNFDTNIAKKELEQMFNRDGLSYGYFEGTDYRNSITELSPKNTGIYLGKVIEKKNKFIKLKLEEDIDLHDGIEIYSEDKVVSTIVTCIKDNNGKIVNENVRKGSYVYIGDINSSVSENDLVYKTSSNKLNEKYRNIEDKYKPQILLKVIIKQDLNISTIARFEEQEIITDIEYVPQIANSKSINEDTIIECFSKTKDELFDFNVKECIIDNNLFVPVSAMNDLRRKTVQNIILRIKEKNKICSDNEIKELVDNFINSKELEIKNNNINREKYNSLFIYDYNNVIDYIELYNKKYNKDLQVIYINISAFMKYEKEIFEKYLNKVKIYIHIPNVFFSNLHNYIKNNLDRLVSNGISGVLVGNLTFINELNVLKNKYSINLIADYSLNITNIYSAKKYADIGFDKITILPETSIESIVNISKYFNSEAIDDYITVMTSRYCMIGSFVANRNIGEKCSMPCIKNNYVIKDSYNENHEIILDNIDCIMRIVKKYNNKVGDGYNLNIRNYIL